MQTNMHNIFRERSNSGSHWFCDFQACNLDHFANRVLSLIFRGIEGDNSKKNGQISLGPKNAEP